MQLVSVDWPNCCKECLMLADLKLSVCCILIMFSADLRADDIVWPGWLGPNRDGWVADFAPPKTWPTELQKVWQIEVGEGYGTPIVLGEHCFVHARQGDDEVLLKLQLKNGETVWRQSYAVPFKVGGGGEWHGKGPKANPVLADGRIFTMSSPGDVSAWNADSGKLLWRSEYGRRFKVNRPFWGATTSPIVDDGRVIVHFGNDERGVLVALDVESGKEVWAQGNDGTAYSSPLLVELFGVRQVVEWNHRAVVGVESATGKKLWEYPFPHVGTNQNMPTPSIHNGRVLVGGENRGFHSFEPIRNGNSWSVRKNWYQEKVALDMGSAIVNGDLLFGLSHYSKGQLFCLDTRTGKIKWQTRGREGQYVTMLAVPGHVLALLDNGQLRVIKATADKYEEVARYKVSDAPTWAAPVLLPGVLLVKDRTSLTVWKL